MVWPETSTVADEVNLKLISFDQGRLHHRFTKPTMTLTNIPEIESLDDLRMPPGTHTEWPSTLEERMEVSKQAAEWAPGLVMRLQLAIKRKCGQCIHGPTQVQIREDPERWMEFQRRRRQGIATDQMLHHQLNIGHGFTPRRRAQPSSAHVGIRPLSDIVPSEESATGANASSTMALRAMSKDAEDLEQWRRHVQMGHSPYRRDCLVCVSGQGRDRQRRRIPTPESYTLSVDLAGPFAPGHFQENGAFRYFMTAVYTVPCQDGKPIPESLQTPNGEGRNSGTDTELHTPDRLEPRISNSSGDLGEEAACQFDRCCAESPELPEGLLDPLHQVDDPVELLSEAEMKRADLQNQKWREVTKELQNFQVRHLTFVIPLRSRHTKEILRGLALLHARLRVLHLPLIRLHSDRAKEFLAHQVQEWILARDIYHTTSAGDEAQGNSRVEGEINWIKGRVRTVMAASKCPSEYWPLAAFHCGEERLRSQLREMGISLPALVPFGTTGMAKTKRWHRRVEDDPGWSKPMRQITVWGPAWQMSPSSRGYYAQMDGKFLRSTVIVQCSPPPPAVAEPDLEDRPLPPLGEFEDDAESEAAGGEMEVLQEGREDIRETFVEEVDPQLRKCEPKAAPTRHRLHGKQHVPVICAMSTKGEWTWSVDFSEEQEAEGQEYKSYAPKERQAWESFDTMVHAELRQVVPEERNYTDYPDVAEVVRQMEEEVTLLEKRLAKFEKIEEEEMQQWTEESGGFSELVESSYPPECLVTQTITTEEVRKHLMEWTPALRSEYQSLLGHGAIEPITEAQFQAMQQDNH